MVEKKLEATVNKGLQSAKEKLASKMIEAARKEKVGDESTIQEVFNVVFTGNFTKDQKMVVAAMAKFFKQGQEATKRLLIPGRVIKNFDNKAGADKLAKMLSGIGLECRVEMEVVGEPAKKSLLEKAAYTLDAADTPTIKIPKLNEITKKQWAITGVVVMAIAGIIIWYVLKPPVVDGDSFETYQASVEKVIAKAPDDKKAILGRAIDLLTGAGFQFQEHNTFGGNEEVAANMAYGSIKGMGWQQIIDAGEAATERKREFYREEIRNQQQRIADEKKTIAELAPSNENLNALKVSDARIVWTKGDAPIMDFKLTNSSPIAVSRLHIQGRVLDTKGNVVAEDNFFFTTALGIPVNGYKYVSLFAQKDSIWTVDEIRKNWQSMTFKPTIENAEDLNGKLIGVDLRPHYKNIADAEQQIKKLQKELSEIKL